MRRVGRSAVLACAALAAVQAAAKPDLFVGTQGLGHVSPAAAWPFGMVQAGPDTSKSADRYHGDWDHTCGYQHDDPYLWRFSQCRFYGIGCGSLGLVGLFPAAHPVEGTNGLFSARMRKETEAAEPGFYTVTVEPGIRCEIAALAHSAAYRFSFPGGASPRLVVDADWGLQNLAENDEGSAASFGRKVIDGAIRQVSPTRVLVHARQLAWNEVDCWAVLEFSSPVVSSRLLMDSGARRGEIREFAFGANASGVLEVRLALSSRSIRGAAGNLEAEMPRFDFEGVRRRAAEAWAERLGVLDIGPGADEDVRTCLESALYRTFIHPSDIGDVGETAYSNLSLWDVFRAVCPWHTIVAPETSSGLVRSMLDIFERQGYLPISHCFGMDNHCMVGHHAVPVVADACLKGLGGFDRERAFEAVRDSLRRPHVKSNDGTWGLLKEDWDLLDAYGYYPFDLLSADGRDRYHGRRVRGESVSRLLECAYDDACAARMARALGKDDDASFFARRSGFWRNVFDPSTGFMRGRDSAGRWREPFDPKACGAGPWADSDYTEGNAWQYSWHVMHDIPGLVEAMGGRRRFGGRLEALFLESSEVYGPSFVHDVSGLVGQYAHGNEPSHHVAYLFRFSDRPEKTDEYVRRIFREMYRPTPDGCCGNDDSGQMAAWYVFSAMGFYPVDPCGGEYVLGAPQVPKVTIKLEGTVGVGERSDKSHSPTRTRNSNYFTVVAHNLSRENKYVKSVTLNGTPVTDWKIRHADILAGGELLFEMSDRIEKEGSMEHEQPIP